MSPRNVVDSSGWLEYLADAANAEFFASAIEDPDNLLVPSISILAEPPVAVVDTVVDRRGTRQIAEAYLRYLYAPAGQEVAARHYFRPRDPQVLEKHREQFAPLELFRVDQVFGGWTQAHDRHFTDGGVFDRIYGINSQ